MSIPRATTPTISFTFADQTIDLTQATNVYVTFRSGMKKVTKTGTDIEVQARAVGVYLEQKETLAFMEGPVKVQINWTGANGRRAASKVKEIEISEQLLDKVVE